MDAMTMKIDAQYKEIKSRSECNHCGDSSSSYAISETSCDSPTAAFERPSRKRCRSSSIPVSSPVRGALSPVHADLLPPLKRIRDSDSVTDLEVSLEAGYVPYIPREGRASHLRMKSEMKSVREDVLDHVIADEAVAVTYETLGGLITVRDIGGSLPMIEMISAVSGINTRLYSHVGCIESQRVDHDFQRVVDVDLVFLVVDIQYFVSSLVTFLFAVTSFAYLTGDPLNSVEFKRISLTGFRSCASRSRYRSVSKQTTRHLPQSYLMLTLEGFLFITVNTEEYHSECSGNYHKDNA
ncbi:hypothetical protein Tco_1082606 [Tanacetum coccineum]|uniref:Uncharacterized protein n=1 Tax=Tanacetum coccineum TaxID=301880 RepID=A0ABQ5I235_9ASTR